MFSTRSLKLSLSWMFLTVALPIATMAATSPDSPPNILWIIAEDLSPDLGCYGESVVRTPHIDALAEQGVRFTQVIGTSSVCSVNRSSIHTAMYPTSIASQNHRTRPRPPLPEGVDTLPAYFRAAGYYVSNGRGDFDPDNPQWPLTEPGKVDWNFVAPDGGFDGPDWTDRAEGQPFFAQINIAETHRDWTPDKKRPIDPAQHDRMVAFRAQLEAWIEFTDDQGATPEPESSYVPYRNWLDDLERDHLERKGLDKLTPENMYHYWMQHYDYTE